MSKRERVAHLSTSSSPPKRMSMMIYQRSRNPVNPQHIRTAANCHIRRRIANLWHHQCRYQQCHQQPLHLGPMFNLRLLQLRLREMDFLATLLLKPNQVSQHINRKRTHRCTSPALIPIPTFSTSTTATPLLRKGMRTLQPLLVPLLLSNFTLILVDITFRCNIRIFFPTHPMAKSPQHMVSSMTLAIHCTKRVSLLNRGLHELVHDRTLQTRQGSQR